MLPDNYIHAKFGIDEIYVHKGLTHSLLEKLHQRAFLSLDAEDTIVRKHVSHDMVLIFHAKTPTHSLISQFLKFVDQDIHKEDFIKSNTLLNEEEFLEAIKAKKFALVTPKMLLKETYNPAGATV